MLRHRLGVHLPAPFRVVAGQKELGSVHESTFSKREVGPAVLVLAGRSWRAKHVDWRRRVAHVEPADERAVAVARDADQALDRKFILLVDEINRGDIPRIFGELLTVLEKDKRGKAVMLPLNGERFRVPPNVCRGRRGPAETLRTHPRTATDHTRTGGMSTQNRRDSVWHYDAVPDTVRSSRAPSGSPPGATRPRCPLRVSSAVGPGKSRSSSG